MIYKSFLHLQFNKKCEMNNMKNNNITKVYEIGYMLGLNKKDMKSILNDTPSRNEQYYLSDGPPYPCSFYGTISIKDFQ